jgi:predicted nucleotidyltransferase
MNTGIDQETKDKIIALIKALAPQSSIYLFGSRARSTHQERSDVDIALEAKDPLSPFLIGEIRDILEASNIIYKVQIIDINAKSISEKMRANIMHDRILWKE